MIKKQKDWENGNEEQIPIFFPNRKPIFFLTTKKHIISSETAQKLSLHGENNWKL